VAADSPHAQLKSFMARYRPEVARIGRAALAAIRTQLPGTVEMVYDNYNALVKNVDRGSNDRSNA
jgi:hypothetical protein